LEIPVNGFTMSTIAGPIGKNPFDKAPFTPGILGVNDLSAAIAERGRSVRVRRTTEFHRGDDHAHTPSGRWADVRANPNSSYPGLNLLCSVSSPRGLVEEAIIAKFGSKPIARAHLKYYLAGSGKDFDENANIAAWLWQDKGIQRTLAKRIATGRTSGTFADTFKLEQFDYDDQDFRFAFGAIDKLDFEVDYDAGTVHIWFQDRYEWHPVYPGLYTVKEGDVVRETNCVHAAFVELKSSGAADFWMKGEATVPLNVIVPGKGGSGGRNF